MTGLSPRGAGGGERGGLARAGMADDDVNALPGARDVADHCLLLLRQAGCTVEDVIDDGVGDNRDPLTTAAGRAVEEPAFRLEVLGRRVDVFGEAHHPPPAHEAVSCGFERRHVRTGGRGFGERAHDVAANERRVLLGQTGSQLGDRDRRGVHGAASAPPLLPPGRDQVPPAARTHTCLPCPFLPVSPQGRQIQRLLRLAGLERGDLPRPSATAMVTGEVLHDLLPPP
jgi:hypothetical protein